MAPKSLPFHLDALGLLAPFSRPFPKVDFLMHFGRPLAHFWLTLAHFWLPLAHLWLIFGALWLPFGSLWLPFGSLLVPFGSLLVPLGSLLSLWRAIFLLLETPGVIFDIFEHPNCKKSGIAACAPSNASFRRSLSQQARGGYIAAGN